MQSLCLCLPFSLLSLSQMTDLAHICIPPFGVVSPVIYDM